MTDQGGPLVRAVVDAIRPILAEAERQIRLGDRARLDRAELEAWIRSQGLEPPRSPAAEVEHPPPVALRVAR